MKNLLALEMEQMFVSSVYKAIEKMIRMKKKEEVVDASDCDCGGGDDDECLFFFYVHVNDEAKVFLTRWRTMTM